MPDPAPSSLWFVLGFGALGLLIGNLVGLTSESAVTPVMGLLFAFAGSSILALLGKISQEDRQLAGKAIFMLCACCLIGIFLGIVVDEHKLLTPGEFREARIQAALKAESSPNSHASEASASSKYLRSDFIRRANAIDAHKANGDISVDQAYDQMFHLALDLESPHEAKP
jgi:hypothetical protein